jgi:hypothetical protein
MIIALWGEESVREVAATHNERGSRKYILSRGGFCRRDLSVHAFAIAEHPLQGRWFLPTRSQGLF